jgi:Raf kinase inhibitor-like YbhB/YbcL family protein
MSLVLSSSAFPHGGEIPTRHTCEGEDVSPPLAWSGAPAGTRSLALVVDDPDAPDPRAPQVVWVHWVVYNLAPEVSELREAMRPHRLPAGARPGRNDWQKNGYNGPCPPVGRHRYFFKLYALDAVLSELHEPTKAALEAAMEGHVLDRVELVGTYEKRRSRA